MLCDSLVFQDLMRATEMQCLIAESSVNPLVENRSRQPRLGLRPINTSFRTRTHHITMQNALDPPGYGYDCLQDGKHGRQHHKSLLRIGRKHDGLP